MKQTLLAAGLLALAGGGMAGAGEVQTRIQVGALTCPSCGYIAADAMQSVDSVDIVDFVQGDSFEVAIFTVSYDDEKATPALIAEAVNGYGYPAIVLDGPDS